MTAGVISAGRLLLLALLGDEEAVRAVGSLLAEYRELRQATVPWPTYVDPHAKPCADDLYALFGNDEPCETGREA